ncbi:hypothetical protein SAMN05421810_103320 [Amycolatopsis arida]|uniref:DoxX-like family protein n=1 Tax=Amycolatopsis arida TaxID=587909 RepID=A0A1I5SYA3_9PSEU|nr:hypothetical protein [Amycolatopsis arida]TDX96301.1 hypothetical protein CLV69_103438 [Amycolatopsis arida]SFP75739.1 hypothetical protein SAMN05421810_103320 [Amycolatopsis arida]
MTARGWLRPGLAFLAVAYGLAGLTQLLLPKAFFDYFPWVDLLPPYNEHLLRDVGALTVGNALVLAVAAVAMERRLVYTALAANLAFAVPHFVFHTTHLEGFTPAEVISQTGFLVLLVVIPAALLVLAWRRPPG